VDNSPEIKTPDVATEPESARTETMVNLVKEHPIAPDTEALAPAESASEAAPAEANASTGALHAEPGNAVIHRGRSIIGLDIGTRTLKLVHLQTSANGMRLVDAVVTELPPKSDPERFDAISEAVEKVISQAKPRIKAAGCSLSGEGVSTICCLMPRMAEKDLAQAVRWKVAEDNSIDGDRATIGHYVLNPKKKTSNFDVVVAAVPPDIGRMDVLFNTDNPRLSTVITDPIATENVVMAACKAQDRGAIAVLDIGSTASRLSVTGQDGLEFTREVPVGGDSITAALTGKMSIDNKTIEINRQAAEELKKKYSIGAAGTVEAAGLAVPAPRILAAIRPALERLASEVTRSLQFYSQSHNLATIDALLICGGGATLGALPQYLSKETRIPTSPLDPWQMLGFEVEPAVETNPALFAVATGSAIHDKSRINLLPPHIKAKRMISAIRTVSLVVTAFAFLLLSGLAWTANAQKARLQQVMATKRETTAPMQVLADKVATAESYKQELNRRREILKHLGVGKAIHAAILRELSNIMPEGTYLRSVAFPRTGRTQKMELGVDIYSMPSAGSATLKQQLIAALEDSPFFVNVSFTPSRMSNQEEDRAPDEALELTCQVLGFPGD